MIKNKSCLSITLLCLALAAMFSSPLVAGIDVTGVYTSEVSGKRPKTVHEKSNTPQVRLQQNGNKINGSYGEEGGEIEGEINGDEIKFRYFNGRGGRGWGRWKINTETNEMVGNWTASWNGEGKWNLKSAGTIKFSGQRQTTGIASISNSLIQVSSGSGFAVSDKGYIVTNNHVVDGCSRVDVHFRGRAIPTTIVYQDVVNDLAVLQGDFQPATVFAISRRNPAIMQEIYVAGYPFGDQFSSSIKVTKGIVSSLAGLGNNISNIQIDAALQPGNSGGPIFDEKGNVIGVAVAKLDIRKMIEDWGVIPENTNFGIKSTVVVNMLESNGIQIQEAGTESLSNTELGARMNGATYHLSCWMTPAQAQRMAKSKVMFDDQ